MHVASVSFCGRAGDNMDALVALAPSTLGVDGAACVALALNRLRRRAAVRMQAAARGLLSRVRAEWRLFHLVVQWLEASPFSAGTLKEGRSMFAQLVVLRRVVGR